MIIETKFNIGDKVWIINEKRKIDKAFIQKIEIGLHTYRRWNEPKPKSDWLNRLVFYYHLDPSRRDGAFLIYPERLIFARRKEAEEAFRRRRQKLT